MAGRLSLMCLCTAVLLAGCAAAPSKPAAVVPSPAQMVAAIRAAGRADHSVVQVHPVRDPETAHLLEAAHRDESAHRYARAAAALDQALTASPDAPDLLQERAELDIRLGRFDRAEQLARRSYKLGPQLGSLCSRNWQTVIELRVRDGDASGARRARAHLAHCHVRGPVRM